MTKINEIKLQNDLEYIGIIEANNKRLIAGTRRRINYEGIEVYEAMHIIVYDTLTKEIIYSTGNNLWLNMDRLLEGAENVMLVLEKHIADSFYLNKFMDMHFYDCKFNNIERMAKGIIKDKHEEEEKIKRKQTAQERKKLEIELKEVCNSKGILLIDTFATNNNVADGYIIVCNKDLIIKQDSKIFKEMLFDIIKDNRISDYKELNNILIKELEYTLANSLDVNIKAIEQLKQHIEYVNNIAV